MQRLEPRQDRRGGRERELLADHLDHQRAPQVARQAVRAGCRDRARGRRRRARPCADRPRAAARGRPPSDRPPRSRGRSRTTSAGGLSSRSPRKRGCRRRPSLVHSAKPIWATSSGRVQCVPRGIGRASTNGDSGVSRARKPGAEVAQRRRAVAGADLAGIAQTAVLVVADEQRAEVGAAARGLGVAADHELLLPRRTSASASPSSDPACTARRRAWRSVPPSPARHASANRRSESPRQASVSCSAALRPDRVRQALRGARRSGRPVRSSPSISSRSKTQ